MFKILLQRYFICLIGFLENCFIYQVRLQLNVRKDLDLELQPCFQEPPQWCDWLI